VALTMVGAVVLNAFYFGRRMGSIEQALRPLGVIPEKVAKLEGWTDEARDRFDRVERLVERRLNARPSTP
jgi:hypothetical protein